mmetsp:Transcript_24650/g.69016  ORF Transcript_24650/g.69016 Transcript_24650/m.69016 type:complete len:282 (-) Transcript_24650:833-1678(-)
MPPKAMSQPAPSVTTSSPRTAASVLTIRTTRFARLTSSSTVPTSPSTKSLPSPVRTTSPAAPPMITLLPSPPSTSSAPPFDGSSGVSAPTRARVSESCPMYTKAQSPAMTSRPDPAVTRSPPAPPIITLDPSPPSTTSSPPVAHWRVERYLAARTTPSVRSPGPSYPYCATTAPASSSHLATHSSPHTRSDPAPASIRSLPRPPNRTRSRVLPDARISSSPSPTCATKNPSAPAWRVTDSVSSPSRVLMDVVVRGAPVTSEKQVGSRPEHASRPRVLTTES